MNALASGFAPIDGDIFTLIAEAVGERGYALVDGALPPAMVDALFVHQSRLDGDRFSPAGVGREQTHQRNRFVRGDEIAWIEPDDPVGGDFLAWMEQLRLGVNRRLFLGLFDYEAHFARYPAGTFYRRHRDAFGDGSTNRVLSTVLYLNPNWLPGDGGELLLFDGDETESLETVQPVYGRLLVFLSERFPHEVLPTRRTRYSIAGWFRVNNSLGGVVDPAR